MNHWETVKSIIEKVAAAGGSFLDVGEAIGEHPEDLSSAFDVRGRSAEARELYDAARREYLRKNAVIRYTTAPAGYDGFGTIGEPAGFDVQNPSCTWRRVFIDPAHVEWQDRRYGSSCKPCIDEAEWQKLLSYGLAKETKDGQ